CTRLRALGILARRTPCGFRESVAAAEQLFKEAATTLLRGGSARDHNGGDKCGQPDRAKSSHWRWSECDTEGPYHIDRCVQIMTCCPWVGGRTSSALAT